MAPASVPAFPQTRAAGSTSGALRAEVGLAVASPARNVRGGGLAKLAGIKRRDSDASLEDKATPQKKRALFAATPEVARRSALAASPEPPLALAPMLPPGLAELQAIVINLERRPDRLEGCAARLQAYCPWLRFSKFAACDGRQTVMSEREVVTSWHTGSNVVYQKKRAIRKGWDDLDSYQERHLALSPGERGCAVSHIWAWRHCLEQAGGSEKPLLVLEDDAAPTPEFTATLAKAWATTPKDADVMYLGYSQAAEWRREVSPHLVESEYVWTTVGYIVWPAGARRLLGALPVDQPVDNWMAAMAADQQLQAYCVRPKVIHQADAWNVNSDVAHSDEHYWGPNSDIHHSDDFYWGKPNPTAGAADGEAAAAAASASLEGGASSAGAARFLAGGSIAWDLDLDMDSDEDSADNGR
eukprot:TRINITY_DN63800_c0_g1_i1.p1 TRINITY_DN63800_c0_g1~~TRINITY_DN63800_c0_g1_i1.p1  ORF type:complete len:414 (-),score=83.13 TRINITY_DN63800_c0_g1_i1:108-1349(-)